MEQGIGMEKELLNRNLYRQIKSMDKADLAEHSIISMKWARKML